MTGRQHDPWEWFLVALAWLFIALKLTGFINWSWWWVLAPVLIPGALAGLLLAGITVAATVAWLRSRKETR